MSFIFRKLDEIRAYPEPKRKQILLVSTFAITLLIILLWLLNIWLLSAGPKTQTDSANFDFGANIEREWHRIELGLGALKNTISNQF
ncbi:MAG: hypothetical protein A2571_02035 [Candidatus Vogelbacteria bacterium RIFOXYD1_FULL_44_32]|uniref:Uncharacterized protein n=1 Tax=Candidatus Vogelbacteria bacterium RIFOXYD1_FULL_44_32 TaxID=1802438 RepID=A0A1G2QDQ2_9BACT|nr:MAG: hypothetical protein A2571_02035 [Candidatus Vogelbacteria bacterium RIFOXYD1_FULL_44_32]